MLDGYTGFTPVQHTVIRELLQVCEHVTVTVTMDVREQLLAKGKPHELFYMSHKMIRSLSEFTRDMEEPIWVKAGAESRFAKAPALNFLEQNLFRYHRGAYNEEQKEVQIFQAGNPEREMEETARRISRLVREHGYRYGQIAVITGNLEEYGSIARHVFDAAEIPFFVDEKHSVLMNPFVEYLRAALEMTVQGFSYESVFRYLRCGMSDLSRREVDILENYVIALGIRGFRKWNETWVRIYRGMDPAVIMDLNEIREHFTEEVRELAEGFSGKKKTVREYSIYLYDFIVKRQIQEKYKNDKQRLNMELANLYKQENVNPLAGCLPLLVQMPIMIGIFYGIRDFHYVGPANFLWIQSISNPDPMYILPVLSALTTFVQSKQTMPDTSSAQNKMMLYFMPLFIGYISFSFPAGLVLYWVVMNLMQIGQQALMNKATVK